MTTAIAILLAATQQLTFQYLALSAPDSYVLDTKDGPDFAVCYVHPKSASLPVLGIYIGDSPQTFASKGHVTHRPFKLGAQRLRWTLWQTTKANKAERHHAEVQVEGPFGTVPELAPLHIWAEGATDKDLSDMLAIAETIHPDPTAPK